MEKRIELERRGRIPSQVKVLNLDNCRSTNIVGLDDSYVSLELLSLNNVGLTSLKGFPALLSLKRLELSDNRISNGLNFLSGSPKISHLNLSGNKIKDLEALEPLKDFTKLKNLDLFNNDVTSISDYRTKVFALHPSLVYLDGFDREDHEADDSDAEDELNENFSDQNDGSLDIDLATLQLDCDSDADNGPKRTASLPLVMYTLFGLLNLATLLMLSEEEEDEDDDDDDDEDDDDEEISLSAVYNDQLEEEGSEGSVYEAFDREDDDEGVLDEDDEDEDTNNASLNSKKPPETDDSPSTKKRKLAEGSEPAN